MKEFVEFGIIAFTAFANHLLGMIISKIKPDEQKSNHFLGLVFSRWINSLGQIFIVLYIAINQPSGLLSIGINTISKTNNGGAFFAGIFLAILMLSPIIFLIQKIVFHKKNPNLLNEEQWSEHQILETINYRSGIERLVHLSILPLCALAEDFVYRGYLVLLLGNRTGSFLPWAILSVILSVLIHLYQSRKLENIIVHFLLATFFVGITLITQNIFASFGAHLLLNFVSIIKTWNQADKQGVVGQEVVRNKKQVFLWLLFAILNFISLYLFIFWATY
jgi:membrane protease YdiL (CAAX protease family)